MIRYRVRKAIELRDSVTGRPVAASAVRVFTSGDLKRLDKGDGLVVLMDDGKDPGSAEEITISGSTYLKESCMVEKYSKPIDRVNTIWLLPAPGYPVPVGIANISGKAMPGTEISIINERDRESLKPASDCDLSSGSIKLYHERGIDPQGKWYRTVSGDTTAEIFIGSILGKDREYTEYEVFGPEDAATLKSAGLVFYPMMKTYADDKGEYLAVLPFVTAADTPLTMAFSKSAEKIDLQVSPGEKLRIDEGEN